jgi:HK97 family phage prohead protease
VEYKLFPVDDFEFKSDGEQTGYFRARVAVFNNVDDGGDRIVYGAFRASLKSNPRPPIVWSHQWNIPPIGQTLKETETDRGLDVEGKLLLDDKGISGQYAHSVMSGFKVGALKEFSFAFDVKDSVEVTEDGANIRELKALDVFEVGPTLVGMNRETQLLEVASRDGKMLDELAEKIAAKVNPRVNAYRIGGTTFSTNTAGLYFYAGDKAAIASHSTGTTEGTWDGPAAMAAASSASDYRAICAWYSGTNPDERQSYKFPHHRTPGAPAVLAGVRNALARVPQANIPSGDVAGVKAHLNSHLDDAKSMGEADSQVDEEPSGQVDEELAAKIARAQHLLTYQRN